MGGSENQAIRAHEDRAYFRAAVNYTAAVTSFAARLIEKDYFCTLLLDYLSRAEPSLIFKGGTCLAKVHAGFYRMSEDIDFTIPTPTTAGRTQRRRRLCATKRALANLEHEAPILRLGTPLLGANNSTQYTAVVSYVSPCLDHLENIRLDISLREPLMTPVHEGTAESIIRNPASGGQLVRGTQVRCISRLEAMAEKFRAALSRREVAIRDFYDIDVAVNRWELDPGATEFTELVRQKLAIPGYGPREMSMARVDQLRTQVATELRPVLRPADFAAFDLDRAVATVREVAARLGGS